MSERRWELRVVFDTFEDSLDRGAVRVPGVGDATRFVATLRDMWSGCGDDEFHHDVDVVRGTIADIVTARAELIDQLTGPVHWAMMHVVPRSLTVNRVGVR